MKRSEMIKVLSTAISDMTNMSLNIREVDYILRQIERKGMMPPIIYMTDKYPEWFGGEIYSDNWEPEDE